ncbi:MAG: cation:proton antiporter [Sulfuricella denitrificans]|nr:cation:proton antiporter [Sulfuricella denitrificans]
MVEHTLISLSAVVVLGITAQWLGWRLRMPSILLLLIFGILAGPILGWIRPGEMMGPMLYPVVSLAVAVILFEGGLSLSLKEFRAIGGVVLRLVTLGMMAGWLIISLAAYWVLGLSWQLATLLGAVLIVTGPTVISPMLRHVRPTGQSGAILKWEGIVIDPIGAMLAVLVFQAIVLYETEAEPVAAVMLSLLRTVAVGAGTGLTGALGMILLLRREWIPDFLQNPVALMFVVAVFTGANLLQTEAGLLAVTIMGFAMANQRKVSIQHIVEFKENLGVMLIAFIFILLAAHLKHADLDHIGFSSFFFLAILILVARPVSVFLSTLGTRLSRQEKIFLSWMAPRGIVAAAVASIFALRLEEVGLPGADVLVSLTFFVIIGTVTVYGLTAGMVGKRMGLAQANPEGVIFLGARFWARRIARSLQDEGFPVMLVDNDLHNVLAARMEGLPVFYASIFAENVLDQVELGGIGKLLALTSNDDANSLAAMHFARVFERSQIFQLAPEESKLATEVSPHLRGRTVFGDSITHSELTQRFLGNWVIKKTRLSRDFDFEALKDYYLGNVLPLFLISESGRLRIFAADMPLSPQPGDTLLSLVQPKNEDKPVPQQSLQ